MMRRLIAFMLVIGFLTLAGAGFAADERVGYVTSTGLYIRKTPSSTAAALRCAKNGEKLVILKEQGDWYYVRYNDVVSGYVAKKFVSSKKPGGSATTAATTTTASSGSAESLPDRIADIDTPATSKPGDKGADVKKLQQALKLAGYFTSSCDGSFGESTKTAVKKFQKAKGLSPDGIAGKVTIKTLFGESAANDKGTAPSSPAAATQTASVSGSRVEKLDWFKGGSSAIPRGSYFQMKDVRSGTVLKCYHLYGGNHLDAEPATREDTAKLLKIYGGSWSWNRRPVLLAYNGHIYAASMNGMPHGEQSITDNNFDGQFCIHFLNSKTHGSSKVDPDHQACVNEAAKSSW